MKTQKIFKAGNSSVVSLPTNLLKQVGLKAGQPVTVSLNQDKTGLLVTRPGQDTDSATITPKFLSTLEGVNKRYGPALKKLAKL